MKKRVLGLLIAGSVAGAPVVAPAVAPAKAPVIAVAAKSCSSGYTHAVINGAQKCLRRGEFCSKSAKKQYKKYGFSCVYNNGYYRLK